MKKILPFYVIKVLADKRSVTDNISPPYHHIHMHASNKNITEKKIDDEKSTRFRLIH